MRSFFNHTTPIPEATKAAAILSGKQRFHGYLDTLAKNLRKGESISAIFRCRNSNCRGLERCESTAGGSFSDREGRSSAPVEKAGFPANCRASMPRSPTRTSKAPNGSRTGHCSSHSGEK